ncbi:MAG: hypothetical protein JWL99_287 [Streptomyces oryziradicis]|nr:hypothetical protein [Actinacidiphila oryziradicis]
MIAAEEDEDLCLGLVDDRAERAWRGLRAQCLGGGFEGFLGERHAFQEIGSHAAGEGVGVQPGLHTYILKQACDRCS